jgi:hypothetical protein
MKIGEDDEDWGGRRAGLGREARRGMDEIEREWALGRFS